MTKRRLVFETQTKRFYESTNPGSLVENLRDSADHITMLNGRISEYFMQGLSHIGVPTHFIRRLNMREALIHHAEMLPFSVFIRNRADKSYAEAMDFELGAILPEPVFEFRYHNVKGETRPISRRELLKFEFVQNEELDLVVEYAKRVNDFLSGIYWSTGILLIDLTLEFGVQEVDDFPSLIMLADDVGPLQAQLWDLSSSDENNIVRPELKEVASRLGFQ